MGLPCVPGWVINNNRQLMGHAQAYNGTFMESFNALVTSDGATITMTVEQSGGGDLTMNFSDGQSKLDCTPATSIALTAGTDTAPQDNYVYVLQSTRALTLGTDWPATEHIKVAYAYVQSASLVNTGAAGNNWVLILQNWNDEAADAAGQGHVSHMAMRSRRLGAVHVSGTEGVATQDGNDLWVSVSAGVVSQMHEQTFAALDSDTAGAGDPILLVNDSVTPYTQINSLNEITTLADGVAVIGNNKFLTFVLIGVANKGGEVSPMLLNKPTGLYNTAADALTDVDGQAVYSIPSEYKTKSTTAFLIAAFVCKHTATAMEIQSTTDLRGQDPTNVSGGGTGGGDVTSGSALTDNAAVRGDGGAKGVQTSGVLIDDSDNVSAIGTLAMTGQLTTTVATGTSPLAVSSTTEVANLNANRAGGVVALAAPPASEEARIYWDTGDLCFYYYDDARSEWLGTDLEWVDFGIATSVSDGTVLKSDFATVTPNANRGFHPPYAATVVRMIGATNGTFTGSMEIRHGGTNTGTTLGFTASDDESDLTVDHDLSTTLAVGARINISSGTPTNPTLRIGFRRRQV